MVEEICFDECGNKDIFNVAFRGDKEDICELSNYAKIINLAKSEATSECYRGFRQSDCEVNYGMADEEVNKVVDVEEDLVNHPSHYANNGAMECFDEFVLLYGEEAAMAACLFNMHKYRYRANMKGGDTDRAKSDWYVAKYKELKKIVDARECSRHAVFMQDMKQLLDAGASLHIEEPEFAGMYTELFPAD